METFEVREEIIKEEMVKEEIPKQKKAKQASISRTEYIKLMNAWVIPQLNTCVIAENSQICRGCGKQTNSQERILCYECMQIHSKTLKEQFSNNAEEVML